MCGRFSLVKVPARERMVPDDADPAVTKPRRNIAPTQRAAVVTLGDPQHVSYYRWGLIPSWAKEAKVASGMINARAETLTEKPAFAPLLATQRCLVLADSFYEWQNGLPVQISLSGGGVFPMAGLWDRWIHPDGSPWNTFTIITVGPNARMAEIHNRMPAILTREEALKWLSPGLKGPDVLPLLRPFPAEEMQFTPLGQPLVPDEQA